MAEKKSVRRKERRRMSRADAALSMRVEGGGDGGMVPIVTESRNISGSGVYCFSPHYLAPLSKVALTIVLPAVPGRTPSQRLLKCEGLVVRCMTAEGTKKERAYQLACSFIGLEPAARERLEEYVVWRNIQALRTATRPGAKRAPRARRPAAAAPARRGTASAAAAAPRAGATRRATPRKRRTVH